MIEESVVKKVKGKLAYISLEKKAECNGCRCCAFGKNQIITIPALTDVTVKEGDKVRVIMPSKVIGAASFYMYALPLILILIGLLIGKRWGDFGMIISALAALIISLPVVYFIDRLYRRKKKYMPLITEILYKEGDRDDRPKID